MTHQPSATTEKGSMKVKTLKLLFLDPDGFEASSVFISELEKIGLKIIYEDGAHPAYIVDTGIELKD